MKQTLCFKYSNYLVLPILIIISSKNVYFRCGKNQTHLEVTMNKIINKYSTEEHILIYAVGLINITDAYLWIFFPNISQFIHKKMLQSIIVIILRNSWIEITHRIPRIYAQNDFPFYPVSWLFWLISEFLYEFLDLHLL